VLISRSRREGPQSAVLRTVINYDLPGTPAIEQRIGAATLQPARDVTVVNFIAKDNELTG